LTASVKAPGAEEIEVNELTVIVPSRERPWAVAALAAAMAATCTSHTRLVVAVDESDPTAHTYPLQLADTARRAGQSGDIHQLGIGACVAVSASLVAYVQRRPTSTMVEALNRAATEAVETWPGTAVAFLGDDHRPRTAGWDRAYLTALDELGTGIVYGDDLLQRENLPTQCAMTGNIISGLGWMAPPVLRHLFVDNFWRELGRAAGCLRYLPNVTVEHMHPAANKANWDDGYSRVNSGQVWDADEAAWNQFRDSGPLAAAVAVVRVLCAQQASL
jgi:hypothetical protein